MDYPVRSFKEEVPDLDNYSASHFSIYVTVIV